MRENSNLQRGLRPKLERNILLRSARDAQGRGIPNQRRSDSLALTRKRWEFSLTIQTENALGGGGGAGGSGIGFPDGISVDD